MRFRAEFTPQAWINDQAVDVDPQGPTTWDCTEFALANLGYLRRMAERNLGDDFIPDYDDVFMADPTAPEWVRNWGGPFLIRIYDY